MAPIDQETADTVRRENIKMHDRDSATYDVRHPYMRDRLLQARFSRELDLIGSALRQQSNVMALDCGVGTGNLSLKFLDRDWHVTAVDISSGMLKVLRGKAPVGGRLVTVESDIDQFLSAAQGAFDIVAFGASLHHFPDYLRTLEVACKRISPHGILYITGEPSPVERISRAEYLLQRLDEYLNVLYKIVKGPAHLVRVFTRALGLARDGAVDESLAEFHAGSGIDADACLEKIRAAGLRVVHFEQYGALGFRLTRVLARLLRLRLLSQFSIIAVNVQGRGGQEEKA